jgi:CheY-like chemotaxis protein
MPIMDGRKAVRIIRNNKNLLNDDTPIVACSAHVLSTEDRKHLTDIGFTDFITKPITIDNLRAHLSPLSQ